MLKKLAGMEDSASGSPIMSAAHAEALRVPGLSESPEELSIQSYWARPESIHPDPSDQ